MSRIILFSLLVLSTASYSQKKTYKFQIAGTIKGLRDGAVIFLRNENIAADTLAATHVKNGKFLLKGNISEPLLYFINFDTLKQRYVIFLEPGNMQFSGSADSLQYATLKGSAAHDDFVKYQHIFNPLLFDLQKKAETVNNPAYRPKYDSVLNSFRSAVDNIQQHVQAFVSDNKNSPVSAMLLLINQNLSQDYNAMQDRFNALAPEIQTGYYGKIVHEVIVKAMIGAVGTKAVDFSQPDTSGKSVSLSSFKGRYVLVDFWASWCGPCRMENPNLVKAYQRFKDKNFTVLGVSLDKAKAPWIKAIKDDRLDWTQISDLKFWSNEVAVLYGISQIPQNMIVDPGGMIIGKNLRGEELEDFLEDLFKEK